MTTTHLQDKALATLRRDAIRAIRKSERQHARMQIADFKEALKRRSYSEQVKLCNWWIVIAKDCDDE